MKIAIILIIIAYALLLIEKHLRNIKNGKYIELGIYIIMIIMVVIYLGGYRPTANWASRANSFVNHEDELLEVSSQNGVYFHTYHQNEENQYLTTVTERGLLGYYSRVSQYQHENKNVPIDTITFLNYRNDDNELLHYIMLKKIDDKVKSILIDSHEPIVLEFDENNEINVILENVHDHTNVDILALDAQDESIYYYGYPKGSNHISADDFKWHKIRP